MGSFPDFQFLFNKQNTDGRGDIDHRTSLVGKFSGFLIYAMGSHGVGVRTGGEEPIGIGCEVNVSGKGTADGLYLNDFNFPVFGLAW